MKRLLLSFILFHLSFGYAVAQKDCRTIVSVKPVGVEVPVGNVPRLPYQLWVNYSDGAGEFRQVRWMNSGEATEKAEANPDINPAGNIYNVRGYIIGDNTTSNGYPVSAEVKVVNEELRMKNEEFAAAMLKAKALPEDGERVNNARGYAAMVIRYVSDGSGTMDMIERAVRQLKEILNQ